MKPWLRVVLLLAGLGLFGYFIYDAGPSNIVKAYRGLGWWALFALIPFAIVLSIDALGWSFTFAREHIENIRYRTLWYVRLAGEAVNNVIPSMYVGGEATKVYLLHKRGVPVVATTAAAVRSKTAQSVAQSTFIALAAFTAAITLESGTMLPVVNIPAKPVFIGFALVGFLFMGLLFLLQSRGMSMTLLGWVRSLGLKLKRMVKHEERLQRMDEAIYNFYTKSRRRFVRCTLVYLLGWIFDTVEILLVSHVLGMPVAWHEALMIEAFIGVAKAAYVVVPGAFGIQEYAVVMLFVLFDAGGAENAKSLGTQYAIIRRGRELAFTALGWTFLYNDEASLKGITQRVQEEAIEMEAVGAEARMDTLKD